MTNRNASSRYDTFNIAIHGSPHWPESKVWLQGFRSKEERLRAIEDLSIAYAPWFFETLAELDGAPVVLERYQVKYLLDNSTRRIMVATRQGGKSLGVSAAKMHKALTTPGYKCDIISVNITEATDKIRYIKNFYHTLPKRWQPPLGKDNWLSIQFRSGPTASVITSKAASAGVRGGRKDVVFDEAHHILGFEDLYVAALPGTIREQGAHASQVDLLSTPMGKKGRFYDIYANEGSKYSGWSRHKFYWFDVSHFITDYEAARKAWVEEYEENIAHMAEMVERFASPRLHEFVEDLTWDQFLQEFCCEFVDESSAFFPFDLIDRCRKTWIKDEIRRDLPAEAYAKESLLEPWTSRPSNNRNEVYIGVDWAENKVGGDQTSIQIVERLPNGRCMHRYSEVLDKPEYRNFDFQLKHVGDLIGRFNPQRVRIDETGLGRMLAQELKKTHGSVIDPITFTQINKEEMAQLVKALMERDMLWLQYDDKKLRGQIHAIQREILPSGALRYEGKPHDDMFWALALACKGSGKTAFRIWSPAH